MGRKKKQHKHITPVKQTAGTMASPFQGIRVTVGLPLPRSSKNILDVSPPTRFSLDQMYEFSRSLGIEIAELKAHGLNVAHNHNKLANQMWGEWLLICGDDHDFRPDALVMLLDAALQEPFPKIVAGTLPRRDEPFNYVIMMVDKNRMMPSPILPTLDYHVGQQLAGQIMKVDCVGSGFTLYHRSVFDTLPYPWFLYTTRTSPPGMAERTLYDWDGEVSFSTYLEKVASGEVEIDPILLTQKAEQIRSMLGQSRASMDWGPDYYLCMDAWEYGIDCYVHFGVPVRHYDQFAVHPGKFLSYIREDMGNWWHEAMRRLGSTTRQSLRAILDKREIYSVSVKKSAEELEKEYRDAQGLRGDEGQVHLGGDEREGGEGEGGADLEQQAQEQPGDGKAQEQPEAVEA